MRSWEDKRVRRLEVGPGVAPDGLGCAAAGMRKLEEGAQGDRLDINGRGRVYPNVALTI